MYACAKIVLLQKWNLYVPLSSICSVRCVLPFWKLDSHTDKHGSRGCRYGTTGADKISSVPDVLLSVSSSSELCKNKIHFKNSWSSASTQMFKSLTRQYSSLTANSVKLKEDYWCEHASVSGSNGWLDYSFNSVSPAQRNDVGLWHILKPALRYTSPGLFTDSMSYFSNMQRLFSVGVNGNRRCLSQKPDKDLRPKPSAAQLQNVEKFMMEQIPVIFMKKHEYRIYTKDMVFENNWNAVKPQKIIGITGYVLAVVKARFYLHSKYAKVKVTVQNSSIDESLGCVHVDWHLAILSQTKAFMFWKFAFFRFKEGAEAQSEVIEGRSTYYVDNKGFIYRHVLDRMIPEIGPSRDVDSEEGAATTLKSEK